MADKVEQLYEAVESQDQETALKLLKSAGGACQTRDLVKAAKAKDPDGVDYSIFQNLENGSETLTVYAQTRTLNLNSVYSDLPVAGVTQNSCER